MWRGQRSSSNLDSLFSTRTVAQQRLSLKMLCCACYLPVGCGARGMNNVEPELEAACRLTDSLHKPQIHRYPHIMRRPATKALHKFATNS